MSRIPRDRVVRINFELEVLPDGHVSYVENDWTMHDRYKTMTLVPPLVKAIRASNKTKFDAEWDEGDDIVEKKVNAKDAIAWLQWLRTGGDRTIRECVEDILEGVDPSVVVDLLLESAKRVKSVDFGTPRAPKANPVSPEMAKAIKALPRANRAEKLIELLGTRYTIENNPTKRFELNVPTVAKELGVSPQKLTKELEDYVEKETLKVSGTSVRPPSGSGNPSGKGWTKRSMWQPLRSGMRKGRDLT